MEGKYDNGESVSCDDSSAQCDCVFLHHKEKNLLRLCIEARTMLIARVLETYIVGFDEKEDLRSVLMYAYLFFDRNYECELSFGSSAKKHL